jgi:protein TonB
VVVIEAILDATGRVESLKVLSSQPLLDNAAVQAVRQWRYTPTELNGVPVPVLMTITVRFSLDR